MLLVICLFYIKFRVFGLQKSYIKVINFRKYSLTFTNFKNYI